MGLTSDGPDGAGESLPDAQEGSVSFERKTRSYGISDGEQEGHAEDSTRKVSVEDLRRVQGDEGAEGKRSFAAHTKEAQADQVRRCMGKGKNHAKVGGFESNRSMVFGLVLFLFWFLLIFPGVVYPCLSSSSDDHHLSHSRLGTGTLFGT